MAASPSSATPPPLPKLAFVAASAPQCVLGGAGMAPFGMVAALFKSAPDALKTMLDSGILLAPCR